LGPVLGGTMRQAGLSHSLNFLLLAVPCFVCGGLVLLPWFRTLRKEDDLSLAG
jgi:hypothetical protein